MFRPIPISPIIFYMILKFIVSSTTFKILILSYLYNKLCYFNQFM